MVSVSIFALRDVIRRVQSQYKIPHNGMSHTSPSTKEDIDRLCKYLRENELQSYQPKRRNNQYATPARDLMAAGAEYANKAGAFKNFKRDTRKTVNRGTTEAAPAAVGAAGVDDVEYESDEGEEADHDLRVDVSLNIDDLSMDDKEFPAGTDINF